MAHIYADRRVGPQNGRAEWPWRCFDGDILFGGLASNAALRRHNLRIVTDITIVGPRTLVTAGA